MIDSVSERDMRLKRTVRPMGAQERLLYLYSRRHHRHFCLVGEISGCFGFLELGAALYKAQMRHPHLWYAVEDDDDGPHFIEHIRPAPLETREPKGRDGWRGTVEAELARPFDPWVAPLLRVAVVQAQSESRRFYVVLTFHHAIADGLSGVALLNDIVSSLNGNELVVAPRRPSVEDLVRCSENKQPGDATGRSVQDCAAVGRVRSQSLWRPFSGDRPQITSASLDRNTTNALIENSRKHGTTVNGALSAALAMANAGNHPTGSYSILSPINIRPLANVDPNEVGLFVSVAIVEQRLDLLTSFWDTARSYSDAVSKMRTKENILRNMWRLESSLPQMATTNVACGLARGYDAVISNLGSIHAPPSGGVAKLDAVWGPLVLGRIKNERMIGAATLQGSLRLTEARPIHMPESLGSTAALLTNAALSST
ncbi:MULTISPECIES: phthiocerol/phthiodiolone dimycocerosyl transferase family protein [Rhizobium]|uniref:Phthiocerol/phthiodiolone dimycocerosyl transferase n=1 Tax=Rhizobium rhododendri TaxID=2506430 RepID=A0ABY8IQU3_9HYPH|nr:MULTISPECIES: wax ester/triacylglycerol synthase domain-containing protein [Rhizobium]TQX82723.1 hypothetical protein EQW76_27760 [Rhizobium sp. rho-13.1]TQY05230.1 hypothetical protein EQW74_27630 [Rhizobium sp. rho-1.1]WFS25881.1 condensation domain-containing protein [Rhizobium rhododendri]